jgi:DNA-binding winged helix-turn-helix (wHTH) protein
MLIPAMKPDLRGACLRFERFELDEVDARLTCAGEPVALAPKPFAVLCALARTPGRLVTKNQLLDAVWGHRFVTESVLKSAISELRAALGDDPRQPRYIETVSRRGYRFIAAAAGIPTQSAAAPEWNGAGVASHPTLARLTELCRADAALAGLIRALAATLEREQLVLKDFPTQGASHETLRATPERSVSPADRGDRRPTPVRTIPAPADARRLLAAA